MGFIEEDNRIYMLNEVGKLMAEITFSEIEEGTFNIEHTFVDESLRGQGIASKLVEAAIKKIESKNGIVQATCSYAKKWLAEHKEI